MANINDVTRDLYHIFVEQDEPDDMDYHEDEDDDTEDDDEAPDAAFTPAVGRFSRRSGRMPNA